MVSGREELSLTRTHKLANLTAIALPFIALAVGTTVLWNRGVGPVELGILAVGYVLTGLGVTVGYHRLFTHRAFETFRPVRYAFAVLGEMAVESDLITWVADHRKHHQYSDLPGDPHSPHVEYGDGIRGALLGLWHAHTGWLFRTVGRADKARYAKDILADRGLRAISKLFMPIVFVSLAIPAAVGWLLIGGWYGAVAGLVWGGGIRIFLVHHVTFSINSICHFWGRRRFRVNDESRNVWWLSWVSFGESWHNNHHAFPSSAFHGLRRLEIDPGGLVIRGLERVGLAWNLVRIPAASQERKLLGASAP
jgi:stearoyl-CoA desaturase (Delta-9 desaturase)